MPVAPEDYRAARLALPRLPLPAIIAFAVAGLGGSIFLAYTSISHGEAHYSFKPAEDVPVFAARAVPFGRPFEDAAQRAASIARALTATAADPAVSPTSADRPDDVAATAGPSLVGEVTRDLGGFFRFSAFSGANTYLTLTGTSFGISAQSLPSGFAAPDAELLTAAPVPEVSTWVSGAALLALVAGRGIRASRVRRRRRAGR